MIERYLRQWDRRLRAAESVPWGVRGLAAGLLVAILIALAARLWPLIEVRWVIVLAAIWGAAGLGGALLVVWLWPRPPLAQAQVLDRLLGLRERLSTAVEIQQGALGPPDWLSAKQLADTLRAAEAASAANAIPIRLGRRDALLALAAVALLAAAIWLPNPMQSVLAERAAVREAIEEQIEELAAVREQIAADPQLAKADRQAMLEILEGAIQQLETQALTREEALATLTEAGDRLRALTDDQAEQKAAGLQNAGQGLQDSSITAALAEALVSGDYQVAAAVLEDLSNDLGEQLTRQQELELAEQLAQAAAELADTNPELATQLAQAAQAIEQGDIAAAQQALAQSAQTIAQTGQQVAASRAADQAAAQMSQSGQQIAQAGST